MSKTKTTTKPWKEAQPFVLGAANEAQSTYNANKGQIAANAGAVNSLLPDIVSRYREGSPVFNAGKQYTTDVIAGKYLNGNPELENVIRRSNDDIRDNVVGSLGTRGRFGGDTHVRLLSDRLAANESNLRYGNYAQEMSRRDQAAAGAPGYNAAEFAPIGSILQTAQVGSELPFVGSNNYADNIARILGQYTTTTQKQGIGGILAQTAASAAKAYATGGLG